MAEAAKKDIVDFEFENEVKPETKEEVKVEQFLSNVLSNNSSKFNPCDLHGSLKIVAFEIEADRDYSAGTTFSLCKLPQSEIRILGALSKINFNLTGENATLGWAKFRNRHQQIVKGNLVGFGEVKDTHKVQKFLDHLPTQTMKIDSLEGVFLTCVAGEAGKKGDNIDGYIIYVKL